MSLPWREIDTVFFDVGNTLVSIDFDWVAEELGARGVETSPAALRRAEARARPRVSHGIAHRDEKESLDTFTFYFGLVLSQLEAEALPQERRDELGPALRQLPQAAAGREQDEQEPHELHERDQARHGDRLPDARALGRALRRPLRAIGSSEAEHIRIQSLSKHA